MKKVQNSYLEWLETDQLGGFALGNSQCKLLRGYHSLLTTNTSGVRHNLLSTVFPQLEIGGEVFNLSFFEYDQGENRWPDQSLSPTSFSQFPVKSWCFELGECCRLEQSFLQLKGKPTSILKYQLGEASKTVGLKLRPFTSFKAYHKTGQLDELRNLKLRNLPLGFSLESARLETGPLYVYSSASFEYRNHENKKAYLAIEAERGLSSEEDLFSHCELQSELSLEKPLYIIFSSDPEMGDAFRKPEDFATLAEALWNSELKRRSLHRGARDFAADSYIVRRENDLSIIAGYPWFTEWARDSFIAIRGLLLARGKFKEAEKVFLRWAKVLEKGLLPNRINDQNEMEFNSVDGSLWFVLSLSEFLQESSSELSEENREVLIEAGCSIISHYLSGTLFNIKCDTDGLIKAGEPGLQLTWMDARVGEQVFTPRIGKPVEVQALWLNCLKLFSEFVSKSTAKDYQELFEKGIISFKEKFWNSDENCCFDVVDVDHCSGKKDNSIRPNMLFAAGGLPISLLPQDQSTMVVEKCLEELFTPAGIRSLSPKDPQYIGCYEGDVIERDSSYHQGTGWYWLVGPFIEAWAKSHDPALSPEVKKEAHRRFLMPLIEKADGNGGHLAELSDGDPPFNDKGCPFQAWSLAEILRLELKVLND